MHLTSARHALGLTMLLLLVTAAGCSFDDAASCASSSDCYDGRICVQNLCQDPDGIDLGDDLGGDLGGDQSGDLSLPDDGQPDQGPNPDAGFDQGPDPDMTPDLGVDQGPDPDMAVDLGPDMTTPDMDLDMPAPDMTTPDMTTPDMELDMPAPDMAPDMTTPDMAVDMAPDMTVPDMAVDMAPDMTTPDMAPDMAVDMGPDMTTPDMGGIGPQIVVIPRGTIDFGNVAVGATVTDTVAVKNVGDAPLVIGLANLRSAPSQAFGVMPTVGPMAALTLQPGGQHTFTVSFTPSSRNNFGNGVFFESNDLDDPRVEVDLRGAGTNKVNQICLNSSPDEVDYGVVAPGDSATRTVTLVNCGNNSPVTVTQLNITPNGPFSLVTPPQLPFTIPVNQTRTLQVRFAPTSAQEVEADLRIHSDSQLGPLQTVELEGSGGGCAEPVAFGQVQSALMWPTQPSEGPLVAVVGDQITLEGGMSSSPSGQVGYAWSFASLPPMSMAILMGAATASPTFTPATAGVYEVELDVTDLATGAAGCDTASIDVVALANEPAITAIASWSSNHDFDLHLMRRPGNGPWPGLGDANNDVSYEEPEQEWGNQNTRLDNGFHLGDSTGAGAEGVVLGAREQGRPYRVVVNFSRPLSIQMATVNVSLSVRGANGMTTSHMASKTFGPQEIRRAWIAFEIDAQGNVTTPNTLLP